MLYPRVLRRFFSCVFLSLLSSFASSLPVTLEPDDYAPGTNLSNISSLVTLESRYLDFVDGDFAVVGSTVSASAAAFGLAAPTGTLTFGTAGFGCGTGSCSQVGDFTGLGFFFQQSTSQVSLQGRHGYGAADTPFSFAATWAAFDQAGNLLTQGSTSALYDTAFLIDIVVPNMWSLIIGGQDMTDALMLDRLVFEADGVSVPAPVGLPLLLMALLGMALTRRRNGEAGASHA